MKNRYRLKDSLELFRVYHTVQKHPNSTIGEIRKILDKANGTISEQLTKLEEEGLIIKKRDRKFIRVCVTDKKVICPCCGRTIK